MHEKSLLPQNIQDFVRFILKQNILREESSDQTQSCKNRRKNVKLLNRRLKKGAISTIFKNLPSCYVSEDVPSRSGMALSISRNEKAAKLLEEQTEKFLETDKLKSFDSLVSCLTEEQLPHGYLMHHTSAGVNLMFLSQNQPPVISATIHIDRQLKVSVYSEQQLLPSSTYKHIVDGDNITLFSQVRNLMAFVENFATSDYSLCFLIEKATKLIDKISEMNDCSEQHHRLCSFIQEQLKLIAKSKNQRRYSVDLLLN